jgi:hypothetical protein
MCRLKPLQIVWTTALRPNNGLSKFERVTFNHGVEGWSSSALTKPHHRGSKDPPRSARRGSHAFDTLFDALGASFCNAHGNSQRDLIGQIARLIDHWKAGSNYLARPLNVRRGEVHFHALNMRQASLVFHPFRLPQSNLRVAQFGR